MSLPHITVQHTPQQIEQALLHNSTIYDDRGGEGIQGIFWHNAESPETPWTYDYFGYCGDKKSVLDECGNWIAEPHRHEFKSFADLMFYAAFCGLEMS